ncbi:hypothetical protein Tco_1446798 [Tanacetum coccineum]
MASHRSKSLYAIKECSTCGSLYTKDCCSIGSLNDKILVSESDSSPCCARCGTPVDGPSCRGCAFLRKKFDEDLLAKRVLKMEFSKTFKILPNHPTTIPTLLMLFESHALSIKTPVKNLRKILHRLTIIVVMSAVIHQMEFFVDNAFVNLVAKDSVYRQEALNKILKEFEELKRDQRMLTELKKQIAEEQTVKGDMSIEEMRHEQQLVDRKIKEITNDLGIRRFRGEEIDEEYERDCEITIHKLKQDFNVWGSEVRKKEKAYEDEKYAAACRYMLSVTCDDEDDYIPLAITTDLPIEEPDNSLNMGDEHLDTIPATESDEVIKSSVENLVPIPSEFEGISDDSCDVPICDIGRINVESDFVESLINRDTSIDNSSKIDPILEKFAGELAHIAPIPPGIVEADFDPNDDTSNVILREKLLNVHRLISNIKSLKVNSTPDRVLESPSPFPIPVVDSDAFFEESDTSFSHLDNSLPEFETFSDHSEETRSGNTTTHANYSLPEYESFYFDNPSHSYDSTRTSGY